MLMWKWPFNPEVQQLSSVDSSLQTPGLLKDSEASEYQACLDSEPSAAMFPNLKILPMCSDLI